MSLDADVQRYARELQRQGADPRAVAAALLGVTLDRYWLLARPNEAAPGVTLSAEQKLAAEELRPTEPDAGWRKVTGLSRYADIWDPTTGARGPVQEGQWRWRALWALAFTTFEDLHRHGLALRAGGTEIEVWDASNARIVEWFCIGSFRWTYDLIEEGWRTPRAGPPVIPDVTPVFAPWSVAEGRAPRLTDLLGLRRDVRVEADGTVRVFDTLLPDP